MILADPQSLIYFASYVPSPFVFRSIDASAVLMTVVSLTGLALLFYLKLRRRPGLLVALLGAFAAAGAFLAFVP